jgi:GNAT superfamily N-acetyltransferase
VSLLSERIVRIRRALPADAAAMALVHARSWRATYTELLPDAVIGDVLASGPARIERWQTWLASAEPRRGAFVAEVDGHVAGFVFWGPSEGPDAVAETAEVYAIYLDPHVVSSGIGRALFQAAVDDIVAHGFEAAVLWVLDSNARARSFYEAAGWLPDGATKTEERQGGALHEVRYIRTFNAHKTSGA